MNILDIFKESHELLAPHNWVLASASPRRRDLLARLIPSFEVMAMDVDETPLVGEHPESLATRLAEAKARAASAFRPGAICVGADTVVWFFEPNGMTVNLGKPVDTDDAVAILKRLSGRDHFVSTGVCLAIDGDATTFCERSQVRFATLGEAEIKAYVASGEPMDKAGAYAIQGGASRFATLIEGSMSNVIGLPVEALSAVLHPTTTADPPDASRSS